MLENPRVSSDLVQSSRWARLPNHLSDWVTDNPSVMLWGQHVNFGSNPSVNNMDWT